MQERVNLAKGEASAIEAQAVASAKAIGLLADAIRADGGADACGLRVAEQYVSAFKGLAASGSTVVVPANAGDVGGMVAQAMAVYKASVSAQPGGSGGGGSAEAMAAAEVSDFGGSVRVEEIDGGMAGGGEGELPPSPNSEFAPEGIRGEK